MLSSILQQKMFEKQAIFEVFVVNPLASSVH